ncbi:LacI family DNA-binding transcriptional regulator [Streptomyces sp. 3MP-14]|uniref:LacI family DNA-binding transcriptional regulator n=1 Tax=Streptomyces mimosae TaxID=2586635 RepID=A0A5N6A047_9ACTN|nr:LacI family DNA-binding transcriptional regulator [Streptomyces mimosae]KAB8173603.1 LacI family DNA-binding transcriptional regulator [Streptomyces sp. 3MP-14]
MGAVSTGESGSTTVAGRVTIHDVARLAGVSRQTVTRAMNDMTGISAETRTRVLRAASLLGYRPNRAARAMVQGPGTTLGLVIRSLWNPFFAEIAESVIDAVHGRQWNLHLSYVGSGGRDALAVVRDMAPEVDAVIGYLPPEIGSALPSFTGPLIQLDISDGDSADAGFRFAVEHDLGLVVRRFEETGRRRVAMIDGSTTGGPSVRAPVFSELARAAGIWDERGGVVSADESPAGASVAVGELLDRSPGVDAVFVFNDVMALGVMHELTRRGVAIPDDVAVVAMDGIQLGAYSSPPLTTVDLDPRGLGRAAVEAAADILSGQAPRGGRGAQRERRHRLLVRDSG